MYLLLLEEEVVLVERQVREQLGQVARARPVDVHGRRTRHALAADEVSYKDL